MEQTFRMQIMDWQISLTFRAIFIIPVSTETFVNSTDVKISIRSENNFWILLIKLASTLALYGYKRY